MVLIVTKKGGLAIKGIGDTIEIAEGREVPESIFEKNFPEEKRARFRDALIASKLVKETVKNHAAEKKSADKLANDIAKIEANIEEESKKANDFATKGKAADAEASLIKVDKLKAQLTELEAQKGSA